MEQIPLPEGLRSVPRAVLEEYVTSRLRQFSKLFATQLLPGASEQQVEFAYSRAVSALGTAEHHESDSYVLRFKHRCRFFGCTRKECLLCKNNPNKRCKDDDNFDECYADNQVLKSKCDSDVYIELLNAGTGQVASVPGIEVQVSVIDGESFSTASGAKSHVRELLKSDEGNTLIGSYVAGSKPDSHGRLFVKLQEGTTRLPDVHVTDKNDTFHMSGNSYGSFRLMAVAIKRDLYGNAVPLENATPAVSAKFIVKTQRALNDYRKSEYPHFKDELTKLKFIGSITAQRLREIQNHLGYDVPFNCIETVEQLKHLMLYADQNRQVENKLLDLLNMKGKHKHKWDYLREILLEKIVYDDMLHRAWYADDAMTQGLLFSCKQAQVNMDKPIGILHRLNQGGQTHLQVLTSPDPQNADLMKTWRQAAEEAWNVAGHVGWTVVQEPLELVNGAGASVVIPVPGGVPGMGLSNLANSLSPVPSAQDVLDDVPVGSSLTKRHSSGISSPHGLLSDVHPGLMRRSSAASYSQGDLPGTATSAPSAMEFQFQPSGGLGPASTMDLGAGPFQFTSQPRTSITNMVTSGQGEGAMLQDVYRASSAPNMFNVFQAAASPSGAQGQPSMAELLGSRPPVRQGRYRRMSADAGITHVQQMQVQLPPRPVTPDGLYEPGMELSFKRPRAPGLNFADEGLVEMPPQQPPEQQPLRNLHTSRVALYHQESRGRHVPRTRVSSENIGAMQGGSALHQLGGASPFEIEADLDHFLASNLPPIQNTLNFKQEVVGSAASAPLPQMSMGMSMQLPSHNQPSLNIPQPQESMTLRLSNTMQQALHIGEAGVSDQLSQAQMAQMAQALSGHAGQGLDAMQMQQRGLLHSDSDSFNKTMGRFLGRSESDSFKRLLDVSIISPTGMHPDGGFEAFLNQLQGNHPSGN
mmetsp:Transcript_40431/g.89814  ORF Transcript_40431/g.89814 Transcript_40431/m.89814 type:complete len:922 (-) Transcript_40431:1054-3819(-)